MKNTITTLLGSALLATGITSTLIAPAQAAKAKPVSSPTSSTSCNTADVSLGGVSATACSGPIAGNDTGAQGTLLGSLNGGLFSDIVGTGVNWSLAGKSDENSVLNADNGDNIGDWSLDKALSSGTFVLSLKTSNDYSAYLFKGIDFATTGLQGVFNTIGVALNGSGNAGKELSHASLFVADVNEPPVTSVPEPATLMGLGLVASGMVMARRRKSSQSA